MRVFTAALNRTTAIEQLTPRVVATNKISFHKTHLLFDRNVGKIVKAVIKAEYVGYIKKCQTEPLYYPCE